MDFEFHQQDTLALSQRLAFALPTPAMEEEEDYVSWLALDSCISRECTYPFKTPIDYTYPNQDEDDEIESVEFQPGAGSALPQGTGDWIVEFPLAEEIRDPQWIRKFRDEHQSFQESDHDPRDEFQSGLAGTCKCRKGKCGLSLYVYLKRCDHSACERSQEQAQEAARRVEGCLLNKTDRSSNSRPTLTGELKKKKKKIASNYIGKSAAAQNVADESVRDEAPASSTAKNVASTRSPCSTLSTSLSVKKAAEVQNEMRHWSSTSEVTRPRESNPGTAPRIVAQVPNWNDGEWSALLLSKIKALESCGDCASEQGLRGRTPLGKKLEADIAAKGSSKRRFSRPTRSGMQQTSRDLEANGSHNFSSPWSLEDDVSSDDESSATSGPQAEGAGDSSAPKHCHSWSTRLPSEKL